MTREGDENMKRIYIAGPYCPRDVSLHDAARVAEHNVQKAIAKFHELKKQGYEPFVPHLTHYIHIAGSDDYGDWWVDYDLSFLRNWAQAIYMLRGWEKSTGSIKELGVARQLGLMIIYEGEDNEVRN